MLQIHKLTYEIGDRKLLDQIDLTLQAGQKIGLIGSNGAGKTTFFRILAGHLKAQTGTIFKPRNYKIGYLPQEPIAFEKGTLLSAVLAGQAEIQQIKQKLHEIEDRLSKTTENQQTLLNKMSHLQDRLAIFGGYELEAQAKKILCGLGFTGSDFYRPLKDFSGGWRMRAYLAKLLLNKPDLLLLDEPTNHLDLPSLEWLENFLRTFAGSVILISHDRYFLDRIIHLLIELQNGHLNIYHGNYHFYEQEKARHQQRLMKQWEQYQAEVQRIQRFVDRFRYKATKAAQVQSRLKQLEKMPAPEEPEQEKFLRFQIKAAVKSYKDVLQINGLYFRYHEDQPWIFKDADLQMYRGQKMALIGPNGIGKTTLTRLIMGQLKPTRGLIILGQRVKVSYYAQHQVEALNLQKSVLENVQASSAPEFSGKERDILGIFGLTGETVEKPVQVLSGGEKARVSLAKILLSPANFLIMDEPTNHLDLKSREALEYALQNYDGTLLLISHDRYFLDKLVNKVVEIKDGKFVSYEGNYSDYLRLKEKRLFSNEQSILLKQERAKSNQKNISLKRKEQKRLEAEARQKISAQRRALNLLIVELENKIEHAEQRKQELEKRLADPATYQHRDQAIEFQKEYDQLLKNLKDWENQWEKAQLELEALLSQIAKNH